MSSETVKEGMKIGAIMGLLGYPVSVPASRQETQIEENDETMIQRTEASPASVCMANKKAEKNIALFF